MPEPTTRELSRRAVRARISEVAGGLFIARGYDETTVDEIAAASGISQRTFFRYFPTKDEVLFGRFDEVSEDVVAALAERPAGEAPWASLRVILDIALDAFAADAAREHADSFQHFIENSPHLLSNYLRRVNTVQDLLGEALLERTGGQSDPVEAIALKTLVSSAFTCFSGVLAQGLGDHTIAQQRRMLDATMAAVRPARADLGGTQP